MAKKKEGNGEEAADPNSLSLAEALLAPLNSIFEAQVHASRAFLNFFLQMGFRHKYTPEDRKFLEENPSAANNEILEKIKEEDAANNRIKALSDRVRQLKARMPGELTDAERIELADSERELVNLKREWSSLYQQSIEYIDQNGNERTIFIPNLALLPVQPLGIKEANFKYELGVTNATKTDTQIKTADGAARKRPWWIVNPKDIRGEFVPQQKEDSTARSIKIEVSIGTVDIPYGLHKLLSSLTGIAQDAPGNDTNTPK